MRSRSSLANLPANLLIIVLALLPSSCSSGRGFFQTNTTLTPLTDEQARDLMFAVTDPKETVSPESAIDQIRASGDQRFIPILIDTIRFVQIGIVEDTEFNNYVRVLEALSGQRHGDDWPAWVEWYGTTDLTPPPGYTGWKGEMLARIDPRFAQFFDDRLPSTIRVEEIQWGGVQVDGIPSLDNPGMIPPDRASYLTDEDPVFGLEINGEARAYPLSIMDWHEMANDTVGGVPIALSYCTLCGAAIPFLSQRSDGSQYTFGSSGLLYRSNKLMYDRQTNTLWNQLTGEPVMGELAGSDIRLEYAPIVLTTWKAWRSDHPDTLVLDINTGYYRLYVVGVPYGDYFASEDLMFPVWQRSDLLEEKTQIYALNIDGIPKAYPISVLVSEGVINDVIGSTPVVLIAGGESVTINGVSARTGPVSYSAGAEVRAYDRGEWVFHSAPQSGEVLDSEGRQWQITEEALIGPDGEAAPRLPGHLAYWFGWFSFFPQTLVYGFE